MTISFRKIKELLVTYLEENGWSWNSTWVSDSVPSLLTEYWTVQSVWSPSECKFYVGFENWDAFDQVALFISEPVPGEKNESVECVYLAKGWHEQFKQLLTFIEKFRNEFSVKDSALPDDDFSNH